MRSLIWGLPQDAENSNIHGLCFRLRYSWRGRNIMVFTTREFRSRCMHKGYSKRGIRKGAKRIYPRESYNGTLTYRKSSTRERGEYSYSIGIDGGLCQCPSGHIHDQSQEKQGYHNIKRGSQTCIRDYTTTFCGFKRCIKGKSSIQ